MSIIDLHSHSTRSDGKESPTEVFEHAAEAGVNILALTDHDTVKGWSEAAEAAQKLGLGFVPGIEVTSVARVQQEGRQRLISVHLLAYLPDPNHEAFHKMLGDTLTTREARGKSIVDRLSEDIDITWEMVLGHLEEGATIGRPAIADTLVTMGLVQNRSAAFDYYLSTDGPYFVSHDTVDVVQAIELIIKSGGVPIIAHPLTHVTEETNSEDLPREHFELMIEAGLMGFEIFHRDVPEPARNWLLDLADKHELIVTGSSDYHGIHGKPNRLGENTTSSEMFERILSAGNGSQALL
jgi:predicted metal-dependent phosphoesterase TrpH